MIGEDEMNGGPLEAGVHPGGRCRASDLRPGERKEGGGELPRVGSEMHRSLGIVSRAGFPHPVASKKPREVQGLGQGHAIRDRAETGIWASCLSALGDPAL